MREITADNYGRHHISGFTFANPGISDEIAEEWADRTDRLTDRPISIGAHRQDILGITFDFDTLMSVPTD